MNIFITFAASFLLWFMYAGLIVLWLVDGRIKKEQALHALVTGFVAWLAAEIIKQSFPSYRPFVTDGHTPLTLTIPGINDGSFPSGHTAAAFGLASSLWLHKRKTGWLYLFLALAVGVARVLAYVHYPVDILGGALLGILIAFVLEKLHFRKLFKRVNGEQSRTIDN